MLNSSNLCMANDPRSTWCTRLEFLSWSSRLPSHHRMVYYVGSKMVCSSLGNRSPLDVISESQVMDQPGVYCGGISITGASVELCNRRPLSWWTTILAGPRIGPPPEVEDKWLSEKVPPECRDWGIWAEEMVAGDSASVSCALRGRRGEPSLWRYGREWDMESELCSDGCTSTP